MLVNWEGLPTDLAKALYLAFDSNALFLHLLINKVREQSCPESSTAVIGLAVVSAQVRQGKERQTCELTLQTLWLSDGRDPLVLPRITYSWRYEILGPWRVPTRGRVEVQDLVLDFERNPLQSF